VVVVSDEIKLYREYAKNIFLAGLLATADIMINLV